MKAPLERVADIVEVVEPYTLLKRHGRELTGLCPFHTEKTPSFMTSAHQTDEVARILAVWRDLGIKDLDGRRASGGFESTGEHLANLRSWRLKSQMSETDG